MSEIPHLNDLEFEDLTVSHGKKSEITDSKKSEEQALIDYSSNIIVALQDLMKSHNKACENKVSLKELKQVFRRGANCEEAKESELSCGALALARVNMFLRLKNGEIMQASRSYEIGKSTDISDYWSPSESDFTAASELAKEHDLNYNFEDINNLYLDEYAEIELEEY